MTTKPVKGEESSIDEVGIIENYENDYVPISEGDFSYTCKVCWSVVSGSNRLDHIKSHISYVKWLEKLAYRLAKVNVFI